MSLLEPGQVFAGRFEIERTAGVGGMGTVYRARDCQSGEFVALKLLHNSGRTEESDRFAREAQLLAELHHPRIVSYIADGQTADGQRFLAMEWLEGEDLAARLSRGPLPLGDALELLRKVAEALSAAHRRGIVHRDLKPTNLFLPDGQIANVKILDFGLARRSIMAVSMTRTGVVLGTPGYMAPEQARGIRELRPAADIFSLGCVLYECLAGEPPFVGEHIAAVLLRILFEEPRPLVQRRLGVPPAVMELLSSMLQKDAGLRLADAMELLTRLLELRETADKGSMPTLTAPVKLLSLFAENQQALLSLVMAAEPEAASNPQGVLPETLPQGTPGRDESRRAAALAAVQALRVRAEIMADGALAATVSQSGSATDQVAVAAHVALLIKEHWPEAVVTVATGRGSSRSRTAVGEIADHAVQLLRCRQLEHATAPADTAAGVWVDELSARLLGPRFLTRPVTEGALLLGVDREVDESRRLLGKPTPCIGRDAELVVMEAQLSSCIEDSAARVMLMTAPPGVGKSRLRHEFLRRLEKRGEPVTVLDGRGDLVSAGAPYGILASAIRRACGLTGGERPEEQRRRLRARIARQVAAADQDRVSSFIGELCSIPFAADNRPMLTAARQDPKLMRSYLQSAIVDWLRAECSACPVLLILDDLQWSDALTTTLLEQVLKQLRDAPLFILALARPEVHEAFPNLWASCGLHELKLKLLSKRSCERLVHQVLGAAVGRDIPASEVARAVEHAAGNALFLEELIRSLAEGKPASSSQTVIAMLQARIGRMELGPRLAVCAAAVFGQTFWIGGVTTILGVSPQAEELDAWLAALVQEEMVQPHPSSRIADDLEYGFRHSLVRDAAYQLLTPSDLLTGHRLAAGFLAAAKEPHSAMTPARESQLHGETLAYHYQQAQMYDKARDALMRAGEAVVRLGASAEARVRFTAALAMIDKLPDTPENRRCKIDVLLQLVKTGMLVEGYEAHLARLARARELLETLESVEGVDPGSAADRLRWGRLHYLYGHLHYYRGQNTEALNYYRKALPIAQEFGDKELLAMPAYMIGAALAVRGYTNQAESVLAQAIEPLLLYGDPMEWLRALLFYGHALMAKGRCQEGLVHMDRGHARAVELNNPELLIMSYVVRSSFFRTCGDWAETIRCSDRTQELAEQLGNPLYLWVARMYRAWAHSALGHPEEAAAERGRALAIGGGAKGRPMLLASWFAAADCEISLNAGRYAETIERAQALLPRLQAEGEFLAERVAERALAVARAFADPTATDELLASCVSALVDTGNLIEAASTHLWWGRVGLHRGDRGLARQHIEMASDQFERSGCTCAYAEAQRLAARIASTETP